MIFYSSSRPLRIYILVITLAQCYKLFLQPFTTPKNWRKFKDRRKASAVSGKTTAGERTRGQTGALGPKENDVNVTGLEIF